MRRGACTYLVRSSFRDVNRYRQASAIAGCASEGEAQAERAAIFHSLTPLADFALTSGRDNSTAFASGTTQHRSHLRTEWSDAHSIPILGNAVLLPDGVDSRDLTAAAARMPRPRLPPRWNTQAFANLGATLTPPTGKSPPPFPRSRVLPPGLTTADGA